jgi:hypothetical protein
MTISFPNNGDCGFNGTTASPKNPVWASSPVKERRRNAKSVNRVFILVVLLLRFNIRIRYCLDDNVKIEKNLSVIGITFLGGRRLRNNLIMWEMSNE